MNALKEEMYEFEEQPSEADLQNPQLEMEIPDVHWAKDIERIENPILREREIEAAKKLIEKEEELDARIESGELSPFDAEIEFESLRSKKAAASTRSLFASVGLTYDHFGSVAEDNFRLSYGNYDYINLSDKVKKAVYDLGPQRAQELADKKLEEGTLSRENYDFISRQVRLSSLK